MYIQNIYTYIHTEHIYIHTYTYIQNVWYIHTYIHVGMFCLDKLASVLGPAVSNVLCSYSMITLLSISVVA